MIRFPLICRLLSTNWIPDVGSSSGTKRISTYALPLQFRASPILCAEPLKKKKKLDPSIVRAKEEKKKKKIMKEIRKLQKLEKSLKPITELELPNCLPEQTEKRKRSIKVSDEVAEERTILLKKWAAFKTKEATSDYKLLKRLIKAQQEALNELRLESEELYQAAVQIDPNFLPFKFTGPAEIPSKQDYPLPDGAYVDLTKKWI